MKKLLAVLGMALAISATAQIDWDDGSVYGTATVRKGTFSMLVLDTSVPRGSHPTQRYKLIPLTLLLKDLVRFEDGIERYVTTTSKRCENIVSADFLAGNNYEGWGKGVRIPAPAIGDGGQIAVAFPMILDRAPWFAIGRDNANPAANNAPGIFAKQATTFGLPNGPDNAIITYEIWCTVRLIEDIWRDFAPEHWLQGWDYPNHAIYFDTNAQVPEEVARIDFDDASGTEGSSVDFTVTLTEPTKARTAAVTVKYRTAQRRGTSRTVASTSDYTATTGTLTFVTGESSKTVSVPTVQDTTREYNEQFDLIFENPVNARIVHSEYNDETYSNVIQGTIIDDDRSTFTVANASVTEGESVTLTVTLNKAIPGYGENPGTTLAMQPVAYTDFNIESNLKATAGVDYERIPGATRIQFEGTAGESHTFTVQTIEDTLDESNELFNVRVRRIENDIPLTSIPATVTITDDD